MTLIETVVVVGLFGLLALLLGDFLLDLARASGAADIRAGLQSEALIHSEDMLATLRASTLTGVAVRGDGARPGFAAIALRTLTSSGQRVWDSRLTMYYWDPPGRGLYRHSCPPANLPPGLAFSPSNPPEFTPTQLDGMFTGGRRLSERITDFEVTLQAQKLTLRLVLQQPVPSQKVEVYETVREITLLSP